jgi:hypothetical protein
MFHRSCGVRRGKEGRRRGKEGKFYVLKLSAHNMK